MYAILYVCSKPKKWRITWMIRIQQFLATFAMDLLFFLPAKVLIYVQSTDNMEDEPKDWTKHI